MIFSKSLTDAIAALSQREQVTPFMTLLAAFATLLYRYTGQEDILIGSPIAGRKFPEIEPLIGFFVNTFVLRLRLQGNPTFAQLLQRVREMALGAYEHQDLPFEKLVEELQPERDASRSPLFQVVFAFQNTENRAWQLPGLSAIDLDTNSGTAKFDLTLFVKETEQGFKFIFEYNADLFDRETIARMAGHFQTLLAGIVENPQQPVSQLPLLTEPERQQLLVEWNDTFTEYPRHHCIHQLFETQVEETPDAIAVVFENQQLTYRELNAKANQLARSLQKLGVEPETLVGLCAERSLEMIVGLIGILKAGGAYVPLDPAYPSERLAFMLSDTRVPVLLGQEHLMARLPEHSARVVCLDSDSEAIARESSDNFSTAVTAENLAYVMYTSGSTGQPKGVSVIHRGVVRLVKQNNYANFSAAEVFLQLAPISFDAATLEIWGSLLNGARLVLMPPHTPSLQELGQAIRHYEVTTLWLTAGLFHLMVDERLEDLKPLRQLLAGGDVLSVPHVQKLLQELPECRVINGYGPTENTTFTCCHAIARSTQFSSSIPIGRPIANTQVYILDSCQQPVPIGVPGELYVGGDGLARGYFNRPNLTREKFIPNPFVGAGEFLYKTGDLARYLPDGNIEFLGRIDNQVKIRGFRIELGEIEAVLEQHPAVKQAIASCLADRQNEKQLVAYIVPHAEQVPAPKELRLYLQEKLPDYMVPKSFAILEKLPLSPNGKIDRRSLPSPEFESFQSESSSESSFTTPRDALEIQLAEIWKQVLGIKSVGVKDNFFELGGHSLLAVRLFAQIEKIFGKTLPLATLFQAPTLELLAEILRQKGWTPPWRSLVPIKIGGKKKPLFCIHAVGGNVLSYQGVASYLSSEQPVYGLQARGLDGKEPPHTNIEEMAADYIKEMQSVQPNGPYFLAGHSFGGVAAFEIAQQLEKAGETVAFLGLFDTFTPTELEKEKPPLRYQISIHQLNLSRLKPEEKLTYILERVTGNLEGLLDKLTGKLNGRYAQQKSDEFPEILQEIEAANRGAFRNYVPQVYPGKVTLFRGIERPTRSYYDPLLGWGEVAAGGVEVVEVPGHHKTMILEPRVRFLAEKLSACLDRAQSQQSQSDSIFHSDKVQARNPAS